MKILLAYDGSAHSDAALDDLTRAGLPAASEITVLSIADVWVMPPNAPSSPPSVPNIAALQAEANTIAQQAIAQAQQLADQAAQSIRTKLPHARVRALAQGNSPVWGILLTAEKAAVDLIVVGSQGRSSLGRWLIGSVSNAVLTHANCSVRIARPGPEDRQEPVKILIGIDGSAKADAAVRAVAQRHWPPRTHVHIVTALDSSLTTAITRPEIAQHMKADSPAATEWIRTVTDTASRQLESTGLTTSISMEAGDPKSVLLEEAQNIQASCIFMGARGLNALDRLLLGSVSTAVATRASCSVEVVRTTMPR